jgi:transcriptional regulator with XRE-family HTH domain
MLNSRILSGKMVMAGFSQKDMAEKLKISKNTMSARMRGKGSFNTNQVAEICDILGIVDPKEKCEIFLSKTSQ